MEHINNQKRFNIINGNSTSLRPLLAIVSQHCFILTAVHLHNSFYTPEKLIPKKVHILTANIPHTPTQICKFLLCGCIINEGVLGGGGEVQGQTSSLSFGWVCLKKSCPVFLISKGKRAERDR